VVLVPTCGTTEHRQACRPGDTPFPRKRKYPVARDPRDTLAAAQSRGLGPSSLWAPGRSPLGEPGATQPGTRRGHGPTGCGEPWYEKKTGNHLMSILHSCNMGRKVKRGVKKLMGRLSSNDMIQLVPMGRRVWASDQTTEVTSHESSIGRCRYASMSGTSDYNEMDHCAPRSSTSHQANLLRDLPHVASYVQSPSEYTIAALPELSSCALLPVQPSFYRAQRDWISGRLSVKAERGQRDKGNGAGQQQNT